MQSYSTGCICRSPETGNPCVSNYQPPSKESKPLELDATGPEAHYTVGRANVVVAPSPPYSVIYKCNSILRKPEDDTDKLSKSLKDIFISSENKTPLSILQDFVPKLLKDTKSDHSLTKTYKLEALFSEYFPKDSIVKNRIEKGTNDGIQVMQWKFMRNARISRSAFLKSCNSIMHDAPLESTPFFKDEEMDVYIIFKSGVTGIDSLPIDDPRRLITPDTISAASFFRLFEVYKVGPWKIIGDLGSGSTSKVQLAINELTGVKAAIKIIPREVHESKLTAEIIAAQKALDKAAEDEARKAGRHHHQHKNKASPEPRAVRDTRIHREISMLLVLSNTQHPSILKLKEALWGERLVFLILDFAKGGSLLTRLTSAKGRFSEDDARPIFRSILSGVAFLHSSGIVHRDLKIENILLDPAEKQAFIIDFGLANYFYSMALELSQKAVQKVTAKTSNRNSKIGISSPCTGSSFHLLDTFCGSLYYAAPELLAGRAYPGPAVDIWSLGVILFAMIAGRVPYDVPGDHVTALHAQIVKGQPSSTLPPDVSLDLVNLISKMLTVDPRQRATARELLTEDPWVLACPTKVSTAICSSLATLPYPSEELYWGLKKPTYSRKKCCKNRLVNLEQQRLEKEEQKSSQDEKVDYHLSTEKNLISIETGTHFPTNTFQDNLGMIDKLSLKVGLETEECEASGLVGHLFSEECCTCCPLLKQNQYRALDAELWAQLNEPMESSTKRLSIADMLIVEIEALLAFQYPQPLIKALLESFFVNSKVIAPCSPMCPWPLVAIFIQLLLTRGKEIDGDRSFSHLWSIFIGMPPAKPTIRLLEDCKEEILAKLKPVLANTKTEPVTIRTIYFREIFKVDTLSDCSFLTQEQVLERLVMSLGHLPGVIGGVVPVSVTRFSKEDAVKLRRVNLYHPSYCKYVVTLQIPSDDRWKEAKELCIRSIDGRPLQVFPMVSMSVELVRIFWTQSYGLIFEHFSGSLETFYQIKTLVRKLVERGETPKTTYVFEHY